MSSRGVASLGLFLARLHALRPCDVEGAAALLRCPLKRSEAKPELKSLWDGYVAYLKGSVKRAERTLWRKSTLPPPLLATTSAWLEAALGDLLRLKSEPSLILLDLNDGNVIVNKKGRLYELSGVVDFGDAMWGDPAMDLVAVFASVLRGRKEELRRLLRAYAREAEKGGGGMRGMRF